VISVRDEKRITFGPFVLDLADECLWRDSLAIPLRPKAFALLGYLIGRPGRLVTKEELLEAVWPETFVGDAVLKVTIRQLREALEDDAKSPRYIETAHRRGYRFIGRVAEGGQAETEEDGSDGTPAAAPQRAAYGALRVVGRDELAAAPAEWHQTAEALRPLDVAGAAVAPRPTAPAQVALADAAMPVASVATRPAHKLPHAVTRFVGREREIGEVLGWLVRARLVTLVGPGGIGKTRLALETVARVLDDYEDGVWLVELAALADPALVTRAVGAALGVPEQGCRSEIECLEAWLRDKRALLVLDNCEHLVAACAELTERLLEASAGLRVLATSRESLGVVGEVAWPVPALNSGGGLESEAAQLFADRASLAKPDFEVTEATAPAVTEVCRRLEGIPLAIELAAARVKTLTVEQILARLDDRFRLLSGGSRTAPSRQQALRATLDWSYNLLTGDERRLLQRLSVFAGGWTLETAESMVSGQRSVGSEDPSRNTDHWPLATEILDLLSRLVDKSLVVMHGQTPEGRFRMLEVVREYALERLRESGAEPDVARRHADVFLALADAAGMRFVGSQEAGWLARLEAEHDNLRAALGWLLEHEPDECLNLAEVLSVFWSLRGHSMEGVQWLTAALNAGDSAPSVLRVRAMQAVGDLAWRRGDLALAHAHLEESLRMARELGDTRQIARSAWQVGALLQQRGDARASGAYLEESLTVAREVGDDRLVGNVLSSLGEAARIEGDSTSACSFYEQSLAAFRRVDHPAGSSVTLCNLGAALCDAGDLEAARSCYLEALPSLRELGNTFGISVALDGLAAVAAGRGEWERAARLAGAASALREPIGGELEPADRTTRERYLREVREHLGEAALEAALAEGRATPRDRAIEDATAFTG
jgi:non-specific serine/threonine protein kinase